MPRKRLITTPSRARLVCVVPECMLNLSGFCHLSLASFMGFVTEPLHSRHVLFSSKRATTSMLEPCALSSACLVSCWSLVFVSRHSWLEFQFCIGVRTLALRVLSRCVSVWSRSVAHSPVHMFCGVHAVCVFIGCVHSCYVLCCVARSLCISLAACFHVVMSSVNTRL